MCCDFVQKTLDVYVNLLYNIYKKGDRSPKNLYNKEEQRMKVNIFTRKLTIQDAKKDMITKKVSKLGKFFDDTAEANVVISEQRDHMIVEVTITSGDMI